MERDKRWEKVEARIGTTQGWVPDDVDATNWVEILIEVPYQGQIWYTKQMIHASDWNDLHNKPDIFDFIMSAMVQQIDDYLDGKR